MATTLEPKGHKNNHLIEKLEERADILAVVFGLIVVAIIAFALLNAGGA